MLWTLLAALGVIAVRMVTAFRLREMKSKLEATVPEIETLHRQVIKAEKANKKNTSQAEGLQGRLTHLKDVIHSLETVIRRPSEHDMGQERARVNQEPDAEE